MTSTVEGSDLAEVSCESVTTMNLFPTKENYNNNMTPQSFSTVNLFPKMETSSVSKSFTKETRNAQMTVFYGGQVVVFDDFPAEKVMEILAFASNKGTSYAQNNFGYAFPHDATRFSSDSQRPVSPQSPSAPVVAVTDIPIARKASLHRFLEKRKDRIASRSPYQTSSPIADPNKPTKSTAWLELAAKPTHI